MTNRRTDRRTKLYRQEKIMPLYNLKWGYNIMSVTLDFNIENIHQHETVNHKILD